MIRKQSLKDFLIITAGVSIVAAAVYFFMLPSHVSVGSATALAMVISNFVPIPVSVITFVLNGALLVVGYCKGSQNEIADVVKTIKQTGCKMLGAVLNGVKFKSLSNKHYYYSSERYSSHYSKRYKYGKKSS